VDERGPDECWPWLAYRAGRGYGKFGISYGVMVLAHRLAYEFRVGKIPAGLFVCHHCDNPPCCNPRHLYAGTHQDNVRDMVSRGRGHGPGLRGEDVGRAILTEAQVVQIREGYTGRRGEQSDLARKYGVTPGAIWRIVHRRNWTHVT
jgi:hypothetical protein